MFFPCPSITATGQKIKACGLAVAPARLSCGNASPPWPMLVTFAPFLVPTGPDQHSMRYAAVFA